MNQKAFDFSSVDYTRSRASDPETSHKGAEHVEGKIGALQRAVLAMASTADARTARELAEMAVELYGGEVESYRKRARELERAAKLKEVGVKQCQITGRECAAFVRV